MGSACSSNKLTSLFKCLKIYPECKAYMDYVDQDISLYVTFLQKILSGINN